MKQNKAIEFLSVTLRVGMNIKEKASRTKNVRLNGKINVTLGGGEVICDRIKDVSLRLPRECTAIEGES